MRFILLIGFILCFQIAISQEDFQRMSISFEKTSLKLAFEEISKNTPYQFYYLEHWVENQYVSGNYIDVPLNLILDDLFKETIINYYLLSNHRIVLTQNNLIYDDLSKNFLYNPGKSVIKTEDKEVIGPLFSDQEKVVDNVKIIRIGKEDANNEKKYYTLSGTVRNSKTGQPIPDLALIVIDENIGTVSNDAGFYKIEIPAGLNLIKMQTLGIESSKWKVIMYNDGKYDFDLDENLELLDEVIVEADAVSNVKDAITGVEQIEIEKIKNIPMVLGERDILKMATTLPGISKAGEGAAGYNVRGGKTDQNLILLDHGVIYNPTHFFGIFSAVNSYSTADLDVYKGSIPAEFGGRLSSVFDIKSKNGNNQKFSVEGGIGPVTGNLTLEIPVFKEKSSLLISGRGTYSDWLLQTLDEESLKNSEASFYDFMAKYHHEFNSKNLFEATAYYSKDNYSISSDSLYTYSNNLISLKWSHTFNDKHRGSLIFANSSYSYNINFDGNPNNNFDFGYKINETEVKFNMHYNVSEKHRLTYGVSSKLYNNDPGYVSPKGNASTIIAVDIEEERALESAIYISDDFNISESFLLSAGLRYSIYNFLGETSQDIYLEGVPKTNETVIETQQYGKNEIAQTYKGPEVRISGRYLLTQSLSLKASYNNIYQFIHTLSNNTTASPTDTYKLSDLNIKPQRANQFSLGIFKNLYENKYELSLEGYYKNSKNIMDYKIGSNLFLNESIEREVLQGDGKSYGIELLARKNHGDFTGWFSYTYSRSLIRFDSEFNEETINQGEYFPANYDKPHDISLVTNYKLSRRFSFSANFVYQTGRPITYPIGAFEYRDDNYVFYSDRNDFRIPDYYRLDVGLNIEGNHKTKKLVHSFWNISVYNLLGRNNPYSVFFVTENGQIKAYKSSIFSVPIPTITYNFKF